MKKLDVQTRLECASAAVAVLRSLQIANGTMTYGQFAEAIGLLSEDGSWKAWHRGQIADILYLISAAQKQGGGNASIILEFDRLVDQKGRHGKGFGKRSRIIKS